MQTRIEWKKLLSFVLAVAMLSTMLVLPASAEGESRFSAKLQFTADAAGKTALPETLSGTADSPVDVYARLVTDTNVSTNNWAVTIAFNKNYLSAVKMTAREYY